MKCCALAIVALALISGPARAHAGKNPAVTQVIMLITELEAKIKLDGEIEQKSYDKYACWCEDTLARKAKDIADAKELIPELQNNIVKYKSEIAAIKAEIVQLNKDIRENKQAQREATEARDAEFKSYSADRTELEQCIGATEVATKVLTGAGTGALQTGFLQAYKEAQLLSVVAGVRNVLRSSKASDVISSEDREIVQRFVEKPDAFMQTGKSPNPHGEYAPQSTQIQGILKGMYDAFVADLEKSNAEEADSQKEYEAFMATKTMELNTMETTLEIQTQDKAEKTKKLSVTELLLDDTKAQLEADEKFFADTKEACEDKAAEWSERVRLRTEELQGVAKTIQILSDPDAKAVFKRSSNVTSFFQLAAARQHTESKQKGQEGAVEHLKSLAAKFHSKKIRKAASDLKNGGHFDKIIAEIDDMIALLRKEEQHDIAHRDRCQNGENKNTNDKADAIAGAAKAQKKIDRLEDDEDDLYTKIWELGNKTISTQTEMSNLLKLRNKQKAEFETALKDDADAVALLEEAILWMSKFYKDNKIPLNLLASVTTTQPEYTEDPDKAPETAWGGKEYGGKKSETTGLVAIISMIKEDVEHEMSTARKDEASDQKEYERQNAALTEVLDTTINSKIATEKELTECEAELADTRELKSQYGKDELAENGLTTALFADCSWVTNTFKTRRDNRKKEIAGLEDAKAYLAGADDGSLLIVGQR